MIFNFKIQDYQTEAVAAVTDVFVGQGFHDATTYIRDRGIQPNLQTTDKNDVDSFDVDGDTGYKNEQILLSDDQLLKNIQQIQNRSNIKQSTSLVRDFGRCSLDIEMETGTGKTYVYIKTIFELNKRYGWSKFIVVVPGIAIREGVKKTFEMTETHFMEHYGKKARAFVYNSSNLSELDSFSKDAGINVMIINMQAFATSLNKDKNVKGGNAAARIIYSKRDDFGSRRCNCR